MSDAAAYNLLSVHYSHVTTLTQLPRELFYNNTFMKDSENIDILCQCLSIQTELQDLNMSSVLITEEAAVKILKALSNLTTLNKTPKELFKENKFLETLENVELLSEFIKR